MITNPGFSQGNFQKVPKKTRILFLLDGSGSMLAPWENTTRIMAAKRLLANMVDSLQTNENLELALRVYGHQFPRREQHCEDSKLEVPFGKDNHQDIITKLMQLKPKGNTPIAYSLTQSANDFPQDGNYRNIIIIITDGLESCGGDPCEVSMALQKKNIFLKPFVIGIGMSKEYETQFGCLGQFFDAKDISSFREVLNLALHQTLEKTTVSVELLDINNKPTETDINVTFINNFTGEATYNFIHYRDKRGRPDSVEIDGVISYDLLINTLPPVLKREVDIKPGQHNVLTVKIPQGELIVNLKGHTEYDKGVKAIIRKKGSAEVVNIVDVQYKEKYLVGNYDLEILTLPPVQIKNAVVNPDEVTTITIPSPGILNINASVRGIGSIYQITDAGKQEWVYNLPEDRTKHTLAIQPGDYRIVFRADNAMGSKYTEIKKFNITSGSTINLKLFGR